MTHRSEVVGAALSLSDQGRTPTEIAAEIGVPRRTVSDWVRGLVPRSQRDAAQSCGTCGAPAHGYDALPVEYVYLLGLYLGDGCLSRHKRDVFKLRLTLDARYPAIIAEAERAVARVVPDNKVNRLTYETYVEVYAYSKAWPCLFPQHGVGKKHERRIVLADWQQRAIDAAPEALLRGLIQSDGCRSSIPGVAG